MKVINFLKKSSTIFYKVFLILFVTAIVIIFASSHVPIEKSAAARIFDDVIWHLKSIPDYLEQTAPDGTPVEVSVNNSKMYYLTSKSSHSTKDILDYYENMYKVDPDIFKKSTLFIDSEEAQSQYEDIINDKIEKRKLDNTIRLETDKWGVLGVLDNVHGTWKGAMEDNFQAFIEAARNMLDTGNVSELGDPKSVIVFRSNSQSNATIFRCWLDNNFNLNSFRPDKTGDWPGKDITAVPRYPHSQRILSFSIPNRGADNQLNVYRSTDRLLGTILFYRSEMSAKGWKTSSVMDNIINKKGSRSTLYFEKQGAICWISLKEKRNYIYHSVLYRTTG